jgi:hypothetical protein
MLITTHSHINVKSKRAGMLSVITNHLTFTDFANEVAFYRRFERGVWGRCPPKAAYMCNVSPAFTATNYWQPEIQ